MTDDEQPAGASADIEIRPATHDDYDDVTAFTRDTWDHVEDYIPDVFHDWVDAANSQTLVADTGDTVVGIAQVVALSPTEGWAQGIRVHPAHRGQGIASALTRGLFAWAREQGISVVRNMVFSWNAAGLGQSRAVGFEPVTEFRWVHPDPGAVADPDAERARAAPDAAWSVWVESDARAHLAGLAVDFDESWAVRELTREMLARAAEETALLVVEDGDSRAVTYRARTYEREPNHGEDDRVETGCEYGVAAWTDGEAARQLFDAIAADAAACGASRTRVLIPETPRHVSAAATLRVALADHTDFIFAADLDGSGA
jgi:GNAT superfamily N-acetyltransferase